METTTLENPVTKDDQMEAQLREAAEKADFGEPHQFSESSAEQSDTRADTTGKKAESTPTNSETSPEKKDDSRPRDELGRFTKREDGTEIPETERKPDERQASADSKSGDGKAVQSVPETAYQKAVKERERQENLLKNFEEDKRKLREEQARFAQERQQFVQQAQQAQHQRNGSQPQYSSEEYAQAAAEFTREAKAARDRGDYEEAEKQLDLAAKANEAAIGARQTEFQTQQQQVAAYYEAQWKEDMEAAVKENKDLLNPESELAKTVTGILGEYPGVFERIPKGFSYAVEVAKLRQSERQKAGLVSELEGKVKTITAERDELRLKTSIGGSGPTYATGSKKFEDMTLSEMEDILKNAASQYDRAA